MMSMEGWVLIVVAVVVAIVAIPVVLLIIALAWPLLVCCYFGHPVIGVLAEVVYLAAMR